MFTKIKIVLAAAAIVGTASAALAGSDRETEPGGYQVQTWCAVNPDCNGWNKHFAVTAGNAGSAYGYASPSHARSAAHAKARRTD
jgi:hypothetical protein